MSNNLYISPATSLPGSENALAVNVKPTLNEKLINTKSNRKKGFPNGIFSKKNRRNLLVSREWGKPPFFTNAKPTSMLERGWIKSRGYIQPNKIGLYTLKDGPEFEVKVIKAVDTEFGDYIGMMYTFQGKSGEIFKAGDNNRNEVWDFYYPTNATPFVPRKGGTKRKTRKMRRKA